MSPLFYSSNLHEHTLTDDTEIDSSPYWIHKVKLLTVYVILSTECNSSQRYQRGIETFLIVATIIWAQTSKWSKDSCSWARHKCKWACWCHVQTQIHMHRKYSIPHSTIAAATTVRPQGERGWIWNVSCHKPDIECTHQGDVQTHPSMEEFGHSQESLGLTGRQVGETPALATESGQAITSSPNLSARVDHVEVSPQMHGDD